MMNKNILIVVVLGTIALLGIWWYIAADQSASDKMMEEKAMMEKKAMEKEEAMKKDEAMMKKDDAMMQSYTVAMKEQNGSKQAGTATIVDVDGKAKVTIKVAAGAKDVAQPAHIHVGACPTPGAVAYPLSAVVNGMSETTLAISTKELMSKLPLAVNVHKSADDAKTYVSCGDIAADAMMKKDDAMMKKDDAMMKKEEGAMMMKGGQYVAYDAAKIAFAKEGKVVLFFRASWCPTCRALDSDIKANASQIPSNVLILDVDYDKYTDLKKQYGVTYQHTLVQVDETGKMIAKWSGSPELGNLLKEVK